MMQNKVKIYCSANCKYNGENEYSLCQHPCKYDGVTAHIDRYYVGKCAFFEARTTEKGGEQE